MISSHHALAAAAKHITSDRIFFPLGGSETMDSVATHALEDSVVIRPLLPIYMRCR
jgi:hypothetical protein